MRSDESSSVRWAKAIAVTLALIAVFALVAITFKSWFLWEAYWHTVDRVASATGASVYLVRALAVLLFAPVLLGLVGILRGGNRRRLGAWLIVYFVAYNLVLYGATRERWVGADGEVVKYWAITEDGLYVSSSPGYAPDGRPLAKADSPERIHWLRKVAAGSDTPVDPCVATWFNINIGEPELWYHDFGDGETDFFNRPGRHPRSGQVLQPVTSALQSDFRRSGRCTGGSIGMVADPDARRWFGADGEPLLWFFQYPDGRFEFFSKPGRHPFTGEALQPVTSEIYYAWKGMPQGAKRAGGSNAGVSPAPRRTGGRDVLVVIDGRGEASGGATSSLAAVVRDGMKQSGYTIVGSHEVGLSDAVVLRKSRAADGVGKLASELARSTDFLLYGWADVRRGSDNNGWAVSARANGELRLIDVRSGAVVASTQLQGVRGFGERLDLASADALQQIGKGMVQELKRDLGAQR